MNTREFKIGKDKFTLINQSFSNSRNWGHISTLLVNGTEVKTAKLFYLNRTWESYQYQSSMKEAIHLFIEDKRSEFIDSFKESQGIKRLSKDKRSQLEIEFKKENKSLFKLLDKI